MLFVTGLYLGAHLHFLHIRQKVNKKLLNFHYCHEAAATDHPWLSSDMAIWSLCVQAACTIRQFLIIRMPLLFGHANSMKSTLEQ